MSSVSKITIWLLVFICTLPFCLHAQFPPQAGLQGTTAITKDDTLFVEWASACVLQRGYMDIAFPDSGYASVGDENSAIDKAGLNGIVSLGDGGIATLTFPYPIYNGSGFDFAVFENGFGTGDSNLAFLELAFVEASSDGNNFFRFPATSNIQDTAQLPMTGIDCSLVNNLAGKYVFGYGTPFDLEELKNEVGLDVNNITHVRLVDVVGSINETFAAYDQYGHKINDPYPTLFPSGGFDLDAVGVIHANTPNSLVDLQFAGYRLQVYPNPVSSANVQLKADESLIGNDVEVFDALGNLVSKTRTEASNSQLLTSNYQSGLYFIKVGNKTTKLVVE